MSTNSSNYTEQNHHYVPRGYFRPWENKERKVFVYERAYGRVYPPYMQSTSKICMKPGLYAYTSSVVPERRNVLEEYLFQRIDSDAAIALNILNNCDSIADVSNKDMQSFALFLASLRIRTPEFFEMNAQSVERRLRKIISDTENDPAVQDLRVSLNERPFIEIAETYFNAVLENKGHELLAKLLIGGKLIKPISNMCWAIISIPEDLEISFLTSDRPFISNRKNENNHLIALTISPRRAIIASSNQADIDHILKIKRHRFAEVMNISVVQQAKAKAFAADKSHSLRFFERRLGTRHSTLPFGKLFDPELVDRRIEEAAKEEVQQRSENLRQLIHHSRADSSAF